MDASPSLGGWQVFYYGAWQWPWALMVAPWGYLVMRAALEAPRGGAVPAQARFVSGYLLVFAVETLLDPVATGPLANALGSEPVSTGLGLLFVLLGDFRIYWLVIHLLAPGDGLRVSALRAAGLSLLVPAVAYLVNGGLAAVLGGVPGQLLWLVHESAFVAVALWMARRLVPARLGGGGERASFLRSVLGYVAVYYALWAAADLLILCGVEEGWAVRLVPNQLYYAFTVPFIHWRFFSVRVQAS